MKLVMSSTVQPCHVVLVCINLVLVSLSSCVNRCAYSRLRVRALRDGNHFVFLYLELLCEIGSSSEFSNSGTERGSRSNLHCSLCR
jgi:hypothetical protein